MKKRHRTAKSKRRSRRRAAAAPSGNGPRYALNKEFEFFSEMRTLLLKPSEEEKQWLVRQVSRLGRIRLAVTAGIFLTHASPETYSSVTDLFIVGDDISKSKVKAFLKTLEAQVGGEIKVSMMDKDEFQYRYDMFDRFIRVLLEGPHEKIINKLGV